MSVLSIPCSTCSDLWCVSGLSISLFCLCVLCHDWLSLSLSFAISVPSLSISLSILMYLFLGFSFCVLLCLSRTLPLSLSLSLSFSFYDSLSLSLSLRVRTFSISVHLPARMSMFRFPQDVPGSRRRCCHRLRMRASALLPPHPIPNTEQSHKDIGIGKGTSRESDRKTDRKTEADSDRKARTRQN